MSEDNNRPESEDTKYQQEPSQSQFKEEAKQMRRDARDAAREARYERRLERRGDGIGVGITFIFIGVIWMLAKLGYLNFSIFASIVDLWPLVFVVIGINIIFRRVAYIGLLTWVGFLTAIIAYGIYFQPQDQIFSSNDIESRMFNHGVTIENGSVSTPANGAKNNGVYTAESGSIPTTGNEQIKEGNLSLNFGAGNVTMGVSHDNIIDYVIPQNLVTKQFDLAGDTASLSFTEKKHMDFTNFVKNKIAYDLYINDKIKWYMDINMGASDCNLNFSQVPVRELEINGGAGDFNLALSDLSDKADISLNMAAGDANLVVPKNVGLRIEVNGMLSDNNFVEQGLTKVNGAFVTPGYETAQKTIQIQINSGASDIKLERR